jgi:hypothetical protein
MTMSLITGAIGVVMLVIFLATMLWWIRAVPLIIVVVSVLALMLYDFVQEMRSEMNGGAR